MHLSDEQLQRMHDGEIPVDAHATACETCSNRLAELAAMSAAVCSVADRSESLSQIARYRLQAGIDQLFERSLIRFAWSLSGIAAAAMIAGSWWLMTQSASPAVSPPAQIAQAPQAAPPWVEAAASVHRISDDTVTATPAAQWYLADASTRNDELP